MATEPQRHPAPFIGAAHRHDLLTQLARTRVGAFDHAINTSVARAVDASQDTKLDGKNGAIDGVAATSPVSAAGIAELPWYFPLPPPKFPKGKESKEGKESKDGKEGKEGKESKDGKEGKDTSDSGKTGGSEASDPFYNFGDVENLNWAVMNQIARIQGTQVSAFLKGVQVF
jgi:hypothetical protein